LVGLSCINYRPNPEKSKGIFGEQWVNNASSNQFCLGVGSRLRPATIDYERGAFGRGRERSRRRLSPLGTISSKIRGEICLRSFRVHLPRGSVPKVSKSPTDMMTPHHTLRASGMILRPSDAILDFAYHRSCVGKNTQKKIPPEGGISLTFRRSRVRRPQRHPSRRAMQPRRRMPCAFSLHPQG
jgi:hypothetical protein